jgi:hypothetical protein
MKVLFALALSLLLSACASTYVPPTPSLNLPAKTKIGVLVVAGDNVNHSHIGTTIFNNFNTSYPYQWRMSDSIFDTLKAQLERPERFEVVDLSKWNRMPLQPLNFVEVRDKNWQFTMEQDLLRKRLLAEGIQVVISVFETPSLAYLECGNYGCNEYQSKHKMLDDFEDPKDFQNITASEMEPVRQSILDYFTSVGEQIKAYLNGEVSGTAS